MLPGVAVLWMRESKGREGGKIESGAVVWRTVVTRQTSPLCPVGEGLEVTCESREKLGDVSRSGVREAEEQESNIVRVARQLRG